MNDLSAHINPYNPAAQSVIQAMKQAFIARGMDAATATRQAMAGLFATVQQQASMMSYADTFFLLAVMFVAGLPLIFLMKKPPKGGGGPAAMGH
jgi:DHA2 family multidrug resistance protein